MSIILDGSTGITTPALTNEGNTTLGDASTDTLNVGNGGIIKDASGNVGVGVTPSAWGANYRALEIEGVVSCLTAPSDNLYIGANWYYDGSNYRYKASDFATMYQQYDGIHAWFTAASGTAGNTISFTTAMTLDANAGLAVGTSATTGYYSFKCSRAGVIGQMLNYNANPYGFEISYQSAAPNGTGNQFLDCGDNLSLRAQIRSNGGLANFSANNVNLSDARLKRDFTPSQNWLEKLCQIEVGTFFYKDQTDDIPNLGVLAQQVEAVAPELVDVSGFGQAPEGEEPYKAIYQTDLQYALLKAIQELKAENDALKARLDALEAK